MLIPDNLRQEHMPMMVYAVCRAVKMEEYSEEDLIKNISATTIVKDEKSANQVGIVLNFAKNAGFVKVENGVCTTEFSNEELETPLAFSSALLSKIELDKSVKYATILKWFLWRGASIEELDTHSDIRKEMIEDSELKLKLNVSEDLTHGFLFWTEFLGIATHSFQKERSMGRYNYSIENILIHYLQKEQKNLVKRGSMPVQEFLDCLTKAIFFIPLCYLNNVICPSLSFALRVVEKMGLVEFEIKNDVTETWHLEKSNTFKTGNDFTNIKVR